jgi:polyisoprenoid-binding protein YceI
MNSKKNLGGVGILGLALALGLAVAAKGPAAERGNPVADGKASAAALPAPGSYEIDPVHTFAYFGARHHVVGLVRGRFENVTGTIDVGKDPAECALDVSVTIASLTTQNTERDKDIRGQAYFDEEKFPTMTYKGKGIRRVGDHWAMDGTLTLHGVAKVVPLTFMFNGAFPDTKPGKPVRVAFHASAGVKRAEFGLGARDNLNELGTLSSPDVQIEIDVEADSKIPGK